VAPTRKERDLDSVAGCLRVVAAEEQADCKVESGLGLSQFRIAIVELQRPEQVDKLENRPQRTEDTVGLAVAVLVHMPTVADMVVGWSAVRGTVDREDGQPY
jgi:hypothetical protein